MKILVFTNIFPYPLTEGGKTAQFVFLEAIAQKHQVILASALPGENEATEAFKKLLPSVKLEFYGTSRKEHSRSFKQKLVEKMIWKLRRWLPKIKTNSILDNSIFMNPVSTRSPEVFSKIQVLVNHHHPDMIQVDFIDNADIASIISGNYKRLLVLHDLRSASVQQAAVAEGYPEEYAFYLAFNVRAQEIAHLRKFDGIISFSNEDAQKLREEGLANVFVSPFAVADNLFNKIDEDGEIRQLVFVGPDHHVPNLDALKWYAERISKKIYDEHGLELLVIGQWSENNRKLFSQYPHIRFAGFVKDLAAGMKNSAMIVPLRIGSGIRTKILEAFAMGIPVISTTVGCEGIGAVNGQELQIADDAESFADAVKALRDKERTVEKCIAAQQLAKAKFSQEIVSAERIRIYNSILDSEISGDKQGIPDRQPK